MSSETRAGVKVNLTLPESHVAPLLALLPLAPARTPRRINTEQSTHASLITSAIPFRHAGPRGKGLPPTATNLLDAWVPTTLEVVSQKQDRPRVCSNGLVTQTQVYTLDGTMSQDKGTDRSPYFCNFGRRSGDIDAGRKPLEERSGSLPIFKLLR